MEVSATFRYAKISPQKARLVVDQIRGLQVGQAISLLKFSPKKAAIFVKKVLSSAIANAEHNNGLDIDQLTVSRTWVDEGPRVTRFHARARGRANRVTKRTCHITVTVE